MSLHLIALDIARRTPSLVNVGGLLEVKFWKVMEDYGKKLGTGE